MLIKVCKNGDLTTCFLQNLCFTFQNKASNEDRKIECTLMLRNEYSDNYKLDIKYVIRKTVNIIFMQINCF